MSLENRLLRFWYKINNCVVSPINCFITIYEMTYSIALNTIKMFNCLSTNRLSNNNYILWFLLPGYITLNDSLSMLPWHHNNRNLGEYTDVRRTTQVPYHHQIFLFIQYLSILLFFHRIVVVPWSASFINKRAMNVVYVTYC